MKIKQLTEQEKKKRKNLMKDEKNWWKCINCGQILYTQKEVDTHKCKGVYPKKYESVMWGHGDYTFKSDVEIHPTAILYEGIKFRPFIKLIMKENTFIGDNCTILVPELIMHKGSQICAGTVLAGRREVILDENAVVGYNCVLLTATDTPYGTYMNDAQPEKERDIKTGRIHLEPNSYVGSNVTIMPDVTIGKYSVVGAGAYIDKSISSHWVVIPKQTLLFKERKDYFKKMKQG